MANKIFLIGLMGSGKSFWAEKLANVLTIPFFDLDAEIERSEKRSITAIFQTDGQDEFRRKEAQALRAHATPPFVVDPDRSMTEVSVLMPR